MLPMSQELDPLNPDSSKAVAKAVEDIEVSLDFKPYLEAVQKGSDRTRSTVYVLLTMVAIAFTSYRSTSNPDWLDLRLTKLQLASACVKDKSGGDLVNNDGSLFS